ncbi:MAG TPA: TIM-barrel domain-containing protein [Bacteroidota bacterium]|nr:TIM-barrel domain-containing protein [Bacteroidota bacterium]
MHPCRIPPLFFLLLFAGVTYPQPSRPWRFDQKQGTITSTSVRLQFLTPSLARLEFDPSGHFVDAPTAVVLKRNWPRVKTEVEEKDSWLIARSKGISVHYRLGSGKFTRENLRIAWRDSTGEHTWSPGDSDQNNLGGISRSLDGAGKDRIPKAGPGILSQAGYFLLDDSPTPLFDEESSWIVERQGTSSQDWYFFIYGRNYRLALRNYSELCGRIPLIPRYTLGPWVTDLNYEYLPGSELVDKYHYSDKDLKDEVNRLRAAGIPIDILVLDFAWHRYGWKGGYDWSPIIPDPKAFLGWAHTAGLKITLNDHPGYGGESVLSDSDSHAADVRAQLKRPIPPPPNFEIDLAKDWKFRTDPGDTGMQANWFAPEADDHDWKTLQGGMMWEDQGFPDYDGVGWYRKSVVLPASLPREVYLIFGGVDDEYDLFINGKKVAHHGSPGNSVYNASTLTDIAPYIKPGDSILIALRVNDWGGGGGIVLKPVSLADRAPAEGIKFNLAERLQAETFMNVLHNPLVDQGVNFWWVDGGSGSCNMPGLNSQMWTNRVYYDFTERHTGKRAIIFSRYGGWGNHRYPAYFTGDTHSQWEVLSAEVPFTARGGNVLMPYITHDIGGFLGEKISYELYARWLEFGTFSPFLRLHSAFENPRDGNLRMPWTYGEKGVQLAKRYFRLRNRLIPYIYTYCRVAHDSALSIVRPLYLEYPKLDKAYLYPNEYLFGTELLVAPVVDSIAQNEIYLPPGKWIDFFTDEQYEGDRVIRRSYAADSIPVFVRAGSIVPGQTDRAYSDERPLDTLLVDVYGIEASGADPKGEFEPNSGRSRGRDEKIPVFQLYEDDGTTLDYRAGKYAWTPISMLKSREGVGQLAIGPTRGKYDGQVTRRTYVVQVHGIPNPRSIQVNDRVLKPGTWSWNRSTSILKLVVDSRSILDQVRVTIK